MITNDEDTKEEGNPRPTNPSPWDYRFEIVSVQSQESSDQHARDNQREQLEHPHEDSPR
jgi:hypothetical protein